LVEFFQNNLHRKAGERYEAEEIVECPDGAVLEIRVCHRTLGKHGRVWSEGTASLLEFPKASQTNRNL
jgi:hypothetical protein